MWPVRQQVLLSRPFPEVTDAMLRFVSPLNGDLHPDDLRTALINNLVSRQQHSGFLLRFDDTQPLRDTEKTVIDLRQLFEKFALRQTTPHYRSNHLHRYRQLADSLLRHKQAYICTCMEETGSTTSRSSVPLPRCKAHCSQNTPEKLRLIADRNIPYVVRLPEPDSPITVEDQLHGEIPVSPTAVGSVILLMPDATPSDDFACAVDDMIDAVTTIIQSDTYVPHAARQIHIRQQLGYDQTVAYAHLPALQVSDDTASILPLLEEGFLPDAIIQYLLQPGIDTDASSFTLPEIVEHFDLRRFPSDPIHFNKTELRKINQLHLRRMDDRSASMLYGFADVAIGQLVKRYTESAATLQELDQFIRPIFAPKPCDGPRAKIMKRLEIVIGTMPIISDFETFRMHLEQQTGLKGDDLLIPLRLLLTGAPQGPSLGEIYPLIRSYITEVARCLH